jgi:hypothetical protein
VERERAAVEAKAVMAVAGLGEGLERVPEEVRGGVGG